MNYARMVIEKEAPEEYGYDRIRFNLSESSIADQKLSDIGLSLPDLTLFYGEHRGEKELRALIAAQDKGLSVDDVLVTAGAAGALFIVATSLLSANDHLVVVRPNYATNIDTPKAIGCAISYVDLDFDNGFAIDLGRVAAAVRPDTGLISVTCPHNPTGTMMSRAELDALIGLAKSRRCRLLVDETYRDLSYGEKLPSAASLSASAISVSSLSKAFGIPGIRIGWLVTSDKELQERFLAAKEQIGICGSVIDEAIARAMLERRDAFLMSLLPQMAKRRDIVQTWIDGEPLVDWVRPQGGVVGFPRLNVDAGFDLDRFYARLLEEHGTYVGPGHWFEMPKRFFRIGFGWPKEAELRGGLEAISAALRG
ncbi:aminotransferase class I/II-fold pyridoxal phosphate-dependent enzyme [Mesorhizobium sp.]|uniref:aminotransferase class I/II-fold pyridoxal phosphate-dependent enzyme n=1 Tax=Mesorhizobium sp. TaxID=1871066 RepID=UPI000FE2C004|nr:aminotransferase class I/II-fold pyridoxal phosphate-dependent enzyme [Mesorhizobium sp.]RWG82264.1 MAG: aminotransferase class I/II-fold pyridoxal phosphate-dependent enzyme [Mesorhizobium sp.]RWG86943.1 MAG: aminotransferase class I/II-fold pyridoxal phosphate-dependent enzyme [Mesorhizobium sp.]RWK03041.1 MAG: aminotransferase class I/II-fold pyridoxal phosphate-dependent enzyme [Mesorhizobium sp.]RWK06961.1 MAG: aminotransferase class I/II-fold pyridoxal phosphate-dependent enzyme [Mesor